jgi:hypothetical protein
MKRKPLTERKRKPKELIPHFEHILLVLSHGTANINYIHRQVAQTGLPGLAYKKNILEAVGYLEEAALIIDISPDKK